MRRGCAAPIRNWLRLNPVSRRALLVMLVMTLWMAIGLLAASLFGPLGNFEHRPSDRAKSKCDVIGIDSAIEEYASAHDGRYPQSLDPLIEPDASGQTFLNTTHLPLDAWHRPYLYSPPQPGQPEPRIWTYGKDGQPGGEGEDADIDSWAVLYPDLALPAPR